MRIISRGVDPKTKPVMATCGQCRATVEFMPNEARRTSDQRDGDFYTVECPVCTCKITANVNSAGMPRPNYYTDH